MRIGSCYGFILLVFESLARRGDATASAGGMHQISTSNQFVIACDAKVTINNRFFAKKTLFGKSEVNHPATEGLWGRFTDVLSRL